MAMSQPLPGESALQYALRVGMSPNDASEYIARLSMGNGGESIPQSIASYIRDRSTPQTAARTASDAAPRPAGQADTRRSYAPTTAT